MQNSLSGTQVTQDEESHANRLEAMHRFTREGKRFATGD